MWFGMTLKAGFVLDTTQYLERMCLRQWVLQGRTEDRSGLVKGASEAGREQRAKAVEMDKQGAAVGR